MKKRIFVILLALFAVLGLVSCKKTDETDPTPTTTVTDVTEVPTPTPTPTPVDPVIAELEETVGLIIPLIRDPRNFIAGLDVMTAIGDISLEWESSKPGIVSVDVQGETVKIEVNRPIGDDVEVDLTVTLSKEGKSVEHVFALYVPALENTVDETDELGEVMTKENVGKTIIVNEVALYREHDTGYYVSTKDGVVAFVYGKASMPTAGKLYKLTAEIDNYFNSLQLKDVNLVEMDGTADHVVTYAETTIAELVTMPMPSAANVYNHDAYKLRDVKVLVEGEGNYNTFLVDKDFDPATDKRTDKNSVMLYYVSQIAELRKIEGIVIEEIDLVLEGYRTDLDIWYFSYLLPMDDLKFVELSPEEAIDVAKAKLVLNKNYYFDQEISLPASVDAVAAEATVVWESSHPEVIGLDGLVVAPEEEVTVTLTATISIELDGETHTGELVQEIKVVAKEIMTLADFLAAEKVEEALIEVVVTSLAPFNSYAVADATGAVAYRVGGKNATNIDVEVGDKILALVKKAEFNGLVQAELLGGNVHVVVEKGVELPAPADITEVELTAEALLPYQSHLVSITSAEVVEVTTDQYNNLSIKIKTEHGEIIARYDDRFKTEGMEPLYELEAGDIVMINAAPIGWTGAGPRIEIDSPYNVILLDIVTIAEFLDMEQGDVATVRGIITHLGPLNSFSMEDETGAFAFRIGGKNANNAGLEIGEELIVEVKMNVFNGLVQGELVNVMISLSKGNDLPELLDLTDHSLENVDLEAHQARLVKLENALVLTHSVDSYGTVQMTVTNGKGSVIVRWDNRIDTVNPEFLNSIKVGDAVTINGATISWFNNAQIMVGATDEVVAGVLPEALQAQADTAVVDADQKALALDVTTFTKAGNLELPETGYNGSAVAWALKEASEFVDITTGAVTMPEEVGTVTVVLVATLTQGEATKTKEITISLVVAEEGEQLSFTEGFEGRGFGSGYADHSFEGPGDTSWEIGHSRNEDVYGIDGDGLMMRRGSDSHVTITFANGLTELSFDMRKAFTGGTTRTIVITINGEEYKEVVLSSVGGADDTVLRVVLDDLLLVGEVVVKIAPKTQGNHQITLDNFEWTENK